MTTTETVRNLVLRLTVPEHEALQRLALDQHRSMNSQVRYLIAQADKGAK